MSKQLTVAEMVAANLAWYNQATAPRKSPQIDLTFIIIGYILPVKPRKVSVKQAPVTLQTLTREEWDLLFFRD